MNPHLALTELESIRTDKLAECGFGHDASAISRARVALRDDSAEREASDTRRLDWLERNLIRMSHARSTHSVLMGGETIFGQLENEARGDGAGPSTFKLSHRTLREALDAAINWKPE